MQCTASSCFFRQTVTRCLCCCLSTTDCTRTTKEKNGKSTCQHLCWVFKLAFETSQLGTSSVPGVHPTDGLMLSKSVTITATVEQCNHVSDVSSQRQQTHLNVWLPMHACQLAKWQAVRSSFKCSSGCEALCVFWRCLSLLGTLSITTMARPNQAVQGT